VLQKARKTEDQSVWVELSENNIKNLSTNFSPLSHSLRSWHKLLLNVNLKGGPSGGRWVAAGGGRGGLVLPRH